MLLESDQRSQESQTASYLVNYIHQVRDLQVLQSRPLSLLTKMRFGQDLHRFQVVEWTPWYIDYRSLKYLHKKAARAALENGVDRSLSGLLPKIPSNVLR